LDPAGRAELVSAAMSELEHLGAEAHAKALALKRGVEWESLDPAGRAELVSAAMCELGPEAHAKASTVALKSGVEWESLDLVGREEMVSAAMSELGHLGPKASTKVLALQRGLDWGSLSPSARDGLKSEVRNEWAHTGLSKKRTEETEACVRKIAQSEGNEWGSMWSLTQESYHNESETVCYNCYVRGSTPQTQKDAFHNLLTGPVRHWMGEDYWGDWAEDRSARNCPPDINGFTHSQQPLTNRVINKCSMITTKLRLSKIVSPFPVFEEHWEPNAVITMADDQGGTLDVKLLELFCFTR